jgi:hypothetical protein
MSTRTPIHELRAKLEAARLQAIEELASKKGTPSIDDLRGLAVLQTALEAVEDEISAHEVKVGGGAETPLR